MDKRRNVQLVIASSQIGQWKGRQTNRSIAWPIPQGEGATANFTPKKQKKVLGFSPEIIGSKWGVMPPFLLSLPPDITGLQPDSQPARRTGRQADKQPSLKSLLFSIIGIYMGCPLDQIQWDKIECLQIFRSIESFSFLYYQKKFLFLVHNSVKNARP